MLVSRHCFDPVRPPVHATATATLMRRERRVDPQKHPTIMEHMAELMNGVREELLSVIEFGGKLDSL